MGAVKTLCYPIWFQSPEKCYPIWVHIRDQACIKGAAGVFETFLQFCTPVLTKTGVQNAENSKKTPKRTRRGRKTAVFLPL